MTNKQPKRQRAQHRIRVRGVPRDEVDIRKLSRALIQLAQAQAEADAQAQQAHKRGRAS